MVRAVGSMRRLRLDYLLGACAVAALLLLASPALHGADVRPFVRGSWKQLRAAHGGRPVVVHFWGVTCAPCMGELPKWGQLAQSKPGVDIVFVAADPIPIEPPNIEAAIVRTGIGTAEQWMFADSFLERLRFEVSPQWGGELPYTVMIDAGGVAQASAGVMDLGALRAWITRQPRRSQPQD